MPAFQDLTGQRFGRLTITKYVGERKWLCQCDCGTLKVICATSFKTGNAKSCGCLNLELLKSRNELKPTIDLTGQRFGRYIVIKKAERNEKSIKWICLCDCGNLRTVDGNDLRRDAAKSCGCLRNELTSIRSKTHGMQSTHTYKAWQSLKNRCLNPNDANYFRYGERGITVCDRWLESFENFLEDMGECPEGLSIDRINNNSGYSKENCRWTTMKVQGNNRRNNCRIEFNGRSQTISEWADELGIKEYIIRNRLKMRWSIERTFSTPIKTRKALPLAQ